MICCSATVKQLLLFNYSHNVCKVYDYIFNIYFCTVLEKYLKILDFFKYIWPKYKYIDFKNLGYKYYSIYLYTLAVSPSLGGSRQHKRNNKNNGGFTPFFQQ